MTNENELGSNTTIINIADRVVSVFSQALSVANLEMHDDFFALGGDSLAAMTIAAGLEHHFEIEIDPAEIFDRPKVGDFIKFFVELGGWIAASELEISRSAPGS